LRRNKIAARQVAGRAGEARNKTKPDRVFGDAEDDWDLRGRAFGRGLGLARAWTAIERLYPHPPHQRLHMPTADLAPLGSQ